MERKVVIITGSRRGLGEATAYKFAEKGYNVVVNDREEEGKVLEVCDNIEDKFGVKALGVMADVSKEDEVKSLLQKVVSTFGRIDCLVNNAGIVYDMELEDRTLDIFDERLETMSIQFI